MRATMSPSKIRIEHVSDPVDDWTHTLTAEDENGASVALLLSDAVFQALWAACEDPQVEEPTEAWGRPAEEQAEARMAAAEWQGEQ